MLYRRIRFGQIGTDPVVKFAVQELQRYMKQMDPSVVIEVLQTDSAVAELTGIIWVGMSSQWIDQLPPVTDAQLDDAIVVSVDNGNGCITGSNNRSVLIAAYRFLKALGCDWVCPGKEGERIPNRKLENICVHICEKASYRHRGVCIEGANSYENVADMIDYLPKIGLNEYFIQFMVPVTFFERWYVPQRNPYQKPEPITRREVAAMTVSLEDEIARRGIRYHKTGHGWTCEPFGLSGTGWGEMDAGETEATILPFTALVNGRRSIWNNKPLYTNLCYSNPAVRSRITDAITQYCKDNTQVDVLHFWLADEVNNQCECSKCREKSPADWYVMMLNELDEKMRKAAVNTKIVFLLYYDLLWPPREERIVNTDRFILMFAPISRLYGQNYADHLEDVTACSPYMRNKLETPKGLAENLAYLRSWQKVFFGDSFVFDYHLMWAHVADPGYERCAKNMFVDMKSLHRMGLNGMVSCQVQRCAFPTALPLYMMAKALWDKDSNYEESAEQYYRAAFGRDAHHVQQYLETVSDLIQVYESTAMGHPVFDKQQMCLDYDAVRRAVEQIRPIITQNMDHDLAGQWFRLKLHTEYVELFVSCLQYLQMGNVPALKETASQLGDWINRNEPLLQKVLDGHNSHRVLFRRLGME